VENKVVVNIFGGEYPITGVSDSAYISKVADYVDSKMKEASDGARVSSREKVAILAAMSIASELLEKSERLSVVESDSNPILDDIIKRLDKALASDSRVS
jgi:cell division protein ZapA